MGGDSYVATGYGATGSTPVNETSLTVTPPVSLMLNIILVKTKHVHTSKCHAALLLVSLYEEFNMYI